MKQNMKSRRQKQKVHNSAQCAGEIHLLKQGKGVHNNMQMRTQLNNKSAA